MQEQSGVYAEKAEMIVAYVLQHVDKGHPLIQAIHTKAVERLAWEISQAPDDFLLSNIGPAHATDDTAQEVAFDDFGEAVAQVRMPAVPKIVTRLHAALNDEDSSADDVAKIIELDTTLSATLLKLVNSPLYSLFSKVDTVSRAVAVLGQKQIYTLAIGQMMSSAISRSVPKNIDIYVFWEHSIACAIVARQIAKMCGYDNQEKFFVAGLLHDVGRILQYIFLPVHTQHIMRTIESKSRPRPVTEIENEVIGFDHAVLGALLLEKWEIPATIMDPVRCHHEPLAAPVIRDASVIHVADMLAHMLVVQPSAIVQVPSAHPQAWHSLGLDTEGIVGLIDNIDEHIQETLSVVLG